MLYKLLSFPDSFQSTPWNLDLTFCVVFVVDENTSFDKTPQSGTDLRELIFIYLSQDASLSMFNWPTPELWYILQHPVVASNNILF